MAYMSQERKAQLAPAIKAVCKKYGVKATIAVSHHMTLVLNIKSGPLNFVEDFIQCDNNRVSGEKLSEGQIEYIRREQYFDVNPYWYQNHFSGNSLAFLEEVFAAMNQGNHNRSDIQSDYFDVGWYVDVNVGSWNKPYILEA
jgi:hypothetical protein